MSRKIAVLTSQDSWFVQYAQNFVELLNNRNYKSELFFKHEDISEKFDIVFILSYFRIISKVYLDKHKHNLVVHESLLPKGRGWAPLFWQILEGKNKIPVVLFEASEAMDEGDIYIKDYIELDGTEVHDEIRKKQADKSVELCLKFLEGDSSLAPIKQKGKPTFYKKRTPKDSEIDVNKSITAQFNLLRIANNEEFPAFFRHKGHKYIVRISKE